MATKYRIIPDDSSKSGAVTAQKTQAGDDLIKTNFRDFYNLKDRFFQIDRYSLVPKTLVNFSLFSQKAMGFELLVQAGEGLPVVLNDEHITHIYYNESEVLIKETDSHLYFAYLNYVAEQSNLPGPEKFRRQTLVVKESAKIAMKEFLEDPRSGEKIKQVRNTVINIADALMENHDLIYTMLSLNRYDYYLYTHCVNVGVLSISLGISIGLPANEFKKLGVGAIIHDVGMTTVPIEIRNKQGKLSDFEYRSIQEHVKEGEKALRDNSEIPKEALYAISQHHEKKSGTGYPYMLKGDEINLFGKITGIADCYDALTTQRPHRKAYNPFEALKVISQEKQNYDLGLLSQFIKMLGKINQ